MTKSRNFSIYLLKKGCDASNALKKDHSLGKPVTGDNLPPGATLYLADYPPRNPWWKSYWGITKNLQQTLKGAIVFLPVDERCVAITFGHTYHNLKPASYEHDFGLRSTLNAVDPDKIRSTDILSPEDAKRERIQSPVASDLTFFDINSDESIVKRLAGTVRPELDSYFRNVSGATNIKVSSKMNASDIQDLCEKLLDIYDRDDYKIAFPDIQNINPVRDPSFTDTLDDLLISAFQERSLDLVLTIPEIIEDDDGYHVTYSGAHGPRKTYDDVFIDHYREFLSSRSIDEVDISQIKHHCLNVKDENGITKKSFSIYQCLLFDCEYDGYHYHLCDSCWYQVEQAYLERLTEQLDPYFVEHPVLQECDHRREDVYNAYISESNPDYLCLDKKDISPTGQTSVEPCDLFTVRGSVANLIHIKISTRSSSLSHLFNQGTNSVELLRLSDEAKNKLKNLVNVEYAEAIDDSNFSVTYGIITAKSNTMKCRALPLFSRISLKRAIQSFKLMAIHCDVILISDNVDRKH